MEHEGSGPSPQDFLYGVAWYPEWEPAQAWREDGHHQKREPYRVLHKTRITRHQALAARGSLELHPSGAREGAPTIADPITSRTCSDRPSSPGPKVLRVLDHRADPALRRLIERVNAVTNRPH